MKNKSQQLDWLEKQIQKDKNELHTEKNSFIQEIKKYKPEDLIKHESKEVKKMTIWQRIKKVLMG